MTPAERNEAALALEELIQDSRGGCDEWRLSRLRTIQRALKTAPAATPQPTERSET